MADIPPLGFLRAGVRVTDQRRMVNRDKVRRLRAEGANLRQIAAKLRVGYETVRLRLRNS